MTDKKDDELAGLQSLDTVPPPMGGGDIYSSQTVMRQVPAEILAAARAGRFRDVPPEPPPPLEVAGLRTPPPPIIEEHSSIEDEATIMQPSRQELPWMSPEDPHMRATVPGIPPPSSRGDRPTPPVPDADLWAQSMGAPSTDQGPPPTPRMVSSPAHGAWPHAPVAQPTPMPPMSPPAARAPEHSEPWGVSPSARPPAVAPAHAQQPHPAPLTPWGRHAAPTPQPFPAVTPDAPSQPPPIAPAAPPIASAPPPPWMPPAHAQPPMPPWTPSAPPPALHSTIPPTERDADLHLPDSERPPFVGLARRGVIGAIALTVIVVLLVLVIMLAARACA